MKPAEQVSAESSSPLPPADPAWKVNLAMLGVLILWASAFIAIRAVRDSFSPAPLALGRLVVGSAALSLLAFRRRGPLPGGIGLWMVVVYGILWFAGYAVVLNTAQHHLDAGTAAILVDIAPLLVAVIAGLFLGEGFPRNLVVGLAVAFVGVIIIGVGGTGGISTRFGVMLGLVAAVLYAAGVITQKIALRTVDSFTATWLGCLIGLAVLLPALPTAISEVGKATTGSILGVIYLGVFPTAIAFSLWAYVLTRTSAGRTASATLAVPPIAILMSWGLLGEIPTLWAMIGGVLCLTGVAISLRRPHRAPSDIDGAMSRS